VVQNPVFGKIQGEKAPTNSYVGNLQLSVVKLQLPASVFLTHDITDQKSQASYRYMNI